MSGEKIVAVTLIVITVILYIGLHALLESVLTQLIRKDKKEDEEE